MTHTYNQGEDDEVELVDVSGVQVYETRDAWRVEVMRMGEREPSTVWLPKSKCDRSGLHMWHVPEWLAKKEGLI